MIKIITAETVYNEKKRLCCFLPEDGAFTTKRLYHIFNKSTLKKEFSIFAPTPTAFLKTVFYAKKT